jgi:hypothetical protein
MEKMQLFLKEACEDSKLTPAHISLYVALVFCWQQNGHLHPVTIHRNEVMRLAKISGRTTYQKCIRELQAYGYIKYIPSFNHFLGSLVYLM